MTSTSPTPVAGKSLLSSRTFWSLAGAIILNLLPTVLASMGVPADQQPEAIGYAQAIGTPLLALAGILFHAISTKPVTSVFPSQSTTTKIMGCLFAVMMVGVLLGGSLTGCTTPALSASQQLTAAKTEYTAESAYNLAASAYLAAEPLLSPTQKATVKGYMVDAYAALIAARDAQKVGDEGTLQAKITALQGIAASVTAITKSVTGS